MRTRADRIRTYLPTVTVHPTASASIRPAGARMSVPNYAIGEFYLMECRNLNSAVARLDRQDPRVGNHKHAKAFARHVIVNRARVRAPAPLPSRSPT